VHVEDRMLVWHLNRGDARALSRVYEKYRDDLLRLAASMLGDRAAAEDIVQDVFVRFAGLATCVANAARNVLKAPARRGAVALDEVMGLASDADGPEHWMICSEEFTRLRSAITRLPPEQREVVTMHLYGQMRFREIADWQKTSIKTVQSRYRYGLDKLRASMNGEVPI
jgi:RNA polymerase sigma-70 factor (ECF subfamily)